MAYHVALPAAAGVPAPDFADFAAEAPTVEIAEELRRPVTSSLVHTFFDADCADELAAEGAEACWSADCEEGVGDACDAEGDGAVG